MATRSGESRNTRRGTPYWESLGDGSYRVSYQFKMLCTVRPYHTAGGLLPVEANARGWVVAFGFDRVLTAATLDEAKQLVDAIAELER